MRNIKPYQIFESKEILHSALINAVTNSNNELLDDIIKQYGKDIKVLVSLNDNELLTIALLNNNWDIIPFFIKNATSSKLNSKMGYSTRAGLENLLEEDRNLCFKILKKFKLHKRNLNEFFIKKGLYKGDLELVKLLIKYQDADPDYKKFGTKGSYETPIMIATHRNHIDIAKYLLDNFELDLHSKEERLLRYAAEFGSTEIMKMLFKKDKFDLTIRDNKVIDLAIKGGHQDMVHLLLQYPEVQPELKHLRYAEKKGYSHQRIFNMLQQDPRIIIPNMLKDKDLKPKLRNVLRKHSFEIENLMR